MTRINLLPPEIKEKVERPRLAPWFILMGVLTLVLIVGLFLYFNAKKSGKEDTLQEQEQQLAELQKQTQRMSTFEQQQADLQALEDLYAQANTGRVAWAQMLNDLAMYVPEGLATASNPKAPAIWLVRMTIDAQSLEAIAGTAEEGAPPPATTAGAVPIQLEGFATPAWLCVQTWLPRASDFKAKGFLDAYPYYYYFRGHPKVAEFFVRLHNMDEWTDLWIERSVEATINETRQVLVLNEEGQPPELQEETYTDWGINFVIQAQWNPDSAIWSTTPAEGEQAAGGGGQ
jgi:Tfp pilus assembly protein PilN